MLTSFKIFGFEHIISILIPIFIGIMFIFFAKKFIASAALSFIKSGKLAFLFRLCYHRYVCFRIKSRLEEPRLFFGNFGNIT